MPSVYVVDKERSYLVDHDEHRALEDVALGSQPPGNHSPIQTQRCDRLVLVRDANLSVDQEEHNVSLLHSVLCLLVDLLLGHRDSLPLRHVPSGVDQTELQSADVSQSLASIARRPRLLAHKRLSPTHQSVEQGRLADVRASHQSDRKLLCLHDLRHFLLFCFLLLHATNQPDEPRQLDLHVLLMHGRDGSGLLQKQQRVWIHRLEGPESPLSPPSTLYPLDCTRKRSRGESSSLGGNASLREEWDHLWCLQSSRLHRNKTAVSVLSMGAELP